MPDRDILNEEDKKFIAENYKSMSVLQMAIRRGIKIENRKCPIISEFVERAGLIKQSPPSPISSTVAAIPEQTTLKEAAKEIIDEKTIDVTAEDTERAVGDISIEEFANNIKELGVTIHQPLTDKERREIRFILHQMDSTRFLLMYRSYRKKDYKQLFREEFIKMIWGKGEMPQEEVNDFIDYAHELVNQYDLRCKSKELENLKDKSVLNKDATQVTILNELLVELNDRYGQSVKRASDIKRSLGMLRQQRLKDKRVEGLTISMLMEAFMDEDKKAALMKLQEKRKTELSDVLDALDNMDETKALLLGVSKEEILNESV